MSDYVLEHIGCVSLEVPNIVHCEIPQGYGGCKYEEASYCHPAVDRAFEVVMVRTLRMNLENSY